MENINNKHEPLPDGWNGLSQTPPEKFVEVIDADGKTAFAEPTYYPFDVVRMAGDERKQWGWRGTVVWHQDGQKRWDGGWMIAAVGMTLREIGTIIGWRESVV
jgi:hypothetical protein